MNQFMNEDLMWERLKDIQREVENMRLYGGRRRPRFRSPLRSVVHALGLLPRWWPRSSARVVDDEADPARSVA